MIFGIGVDAVLVQRMEASMQKAHFRQRVFSKEEQALFSAHNTAHSAETAAACFAGKEAFLKATGIGLGGFALTDIAILRKKSGAPYYHFTGSAAAFCTKNKLTAHITLTHEGGLAIAFAVLEKAQP